MSDIIGLETVSLLYGRYFISISHENMWKYGIWPQHSVIATREQLSKYQKEKISLARRDIRKAEIPNHVMGES